MAAGLLVTGFDGLNSKDDGVNFIFTPKNIFSTKNNPMCGIAFTAWMMIFLEKWSFVELQYVPRILFIFLLSIINSFLGSIENFLYADAIESQRIPIDPIFIIGHPRTGTTLLHNLLSSDESQFFYCTTFCAGFPSSFLWCEDWGKIAFASVIEATRPMDSMPLHFDLPQEDECATNVLSGGASYYMPLWLECSSVCNNTSLDNASTSAGLCDKNRVSESSSTLVPKTGLLRRTRSDGHRRFCTL
jgi:hypothetical protein